jgi:TonB family protein
VKRGSGRPATGRAAGRLLAGLACLAVLLAPSGSWAAGGEAPPTLLRRTLLTTPIEAAGSGVAPEVKVRVKVDARGRVAAVEVLKIEPSTAYDEAFRRDAVASLRLWRYAPARRGGEPVEATLEWSVQFLAREAAAERSPAEGVFLDLAGGEVARRARIARLPRREREEILRRLAVSAEKLLEGKDRRRAESPRFVVVSDSPDAETVQILAGNLESVFTVLDGLFRPAVEPQPEAYKIVAYVYWKRPAFHALLAELGSPDWPNGLYRAPGFLAFHLDVPTVDTLLHLMIHEAFHAYADRHLAHPGRPLPQWFDEGFAEYLGNSEIQKGRILPGRLLKGKYVLGHVAGAYRLKTAAAVGLEEVKRAIRSGAALSVRELVAADGTVFYGEKRDLYYPQSWLLVHFLRHGRPEWAERQFPALALYLAEGYPAEDALAAAYGLAPPELEEPLSAYAKGL